MKCLMKRAIREAQQSRELIKRRIKSGSLCTISITFISVVLKKVSGNNTVYCEHSVPKTRRSREICVFVLSKGRLGLLATRNCVQVLKLI